MLFAQLAAKCSRAHGSKKFSKKFSKNIRRDRLKKKTPLVGAAFTIAHADANAVTPSP
jgi:hypothetical protein